LEYAFLGGRQGAAASSASQSRYQCTSPGRTFVNIAHEDIAGYMKAMVMSFEPRRPGQLDGLSPQDRVDFDFVETEDAWRVLIRIDERP
jgi:hypothetical protein